MGPTNKDCHTAPALPSTEVEHLKKLIAKLRWIGMYDEAQQVCVRLSRIAPAAKVFNEPLDTD